MQHNYPRFKIRIAPDSKQQQRLQVGDIIRRHYQESNISRYSLMAVLETGTEGVTRPDGTLQSTHYFVGGLLEGDEPKNGELLDFVRITSLTDISRSGALYLTSSDNESPYLDVIDGMGNERSLCRPSEDENFCWGYEYLDYSYMPTDEPASRVYTLRRSGVLSGTDTFGLRFPLPASLDHPQRIVISFRSKSSKALVGIPLTVGYSDGSKLDGQMVFDAGTQWSYHLYTVTIDTPPTWTRSLSVDLTNHLTSGDDTLSIADLNVVLLSDLSDYPGASKARVGKITGIVDPLFGKLEGYGAYFQNLYATGNVSIAGTLTAGDQYGASSTFYVGRIYKNCFRNSLSPKIVTEFAESTAIPPTGVGKALILPAGDSILECQNEEWTRLYEGNRYCFSLWAYSSQTQTLSVQYGGKVIGTIEAGIKWQRHAFRLLIVHQVGQPMLISISAPLTCVIASPQLEAGEQATLYQPTDEVLDETKEFDYGAWFNKGGIGGTIQNPLLKLDADGSIRSTNGSFVINADGTGYFAGGKFKWDSEHIVLEELTIDWEKVAEYIPKPITVRASISSNQPLTQIFSRDTNTNTPNWAQSPYLVLTPSLLVSTFGQLDQITTVAGDGKPGIKPGSVVWYKGSQVVESGKNQTLIADAAGKYTLTVKSNAMGTFSPQMTFAFTAVYIDEHGQENPVRTDIQFTKLSAPGATIMAVMQTPDGTVFRDGEPSSLRLHCDLLRGNLIDDANVTYAWGVPDSSVFANTKLAEAVSTGATQIKVQSAENMVVGTEIQIVNAFYTITAVDQQTQTVSVTPSITGNYKANGQVICPRYNAILGAGWLELDADHPQGTISGWRTHELTLSPDSVKGSQTFKCAIRDDDRNKDNPSAGKIASATASISDLTVPDISALEWVQNWDSNKTHLGAELVITPKLFAGIKHDDGLITGIAMGHFPLSMYDGTGTGMTVRNVDGIAGFDHGRKVFSVENSGNVEMGFGSQSIRYNASTGQIEFGAGVSMHWIGATYVDKDGIFTGTLSADTVRAIVLDASQITAGTIESARIDTETLKTILLTAENIESLTLTVKKGTVGGWTIDDTSIYRGTKKDSTAHFTDNLNDITIGRSGIRGRKWRFDADGAGAIAGENIWWDTTGNVHFASSVSASWQAGIDAATELAWAMAYGKMLFRDPTFTNGENNIQAYNTLLNGHVTINRVVNSLAPNDSHQVLEIATTADAAPGYGGFSFGSMAAPDKRFVVRIMAKIPDGYQIRWATSDIGTGGSWQFLTPTEGTGKWEEYICKVVCGGEGTFGACNNFYLETNTGALLPIVWQIAYATVFDITASEKYTTTIDADGIYTGSLTAGQVTTGFLSADRLQAGSIKAEKLDAQSIKASIINTDYINGLKCTFSKGTIGGWSIGATTLSAERLLLDSANKRIVVYGGNSGHESKSVQLFYTSDDDFGIYASDTVGNRVVQLGSTNLIAGWNIDASRLYKNNVALGADGSITNLEKWRLSNDGSGQIACGNISWDATGTVTFSPSVSLSWKNDIQAIKSANYGFSFTQDIVVYGDQDLYYPVIFKGGEQTVKREILVRRAYDEQAPDSWNPDLATYHGGMILSIKANFGGWGGIYYSWDIYELSEIYCRMFAGAMHCGNDAMFAIFLRGGGTGGAVYHLYSDQDMVSSYASPDPIPPSPQICYNSDLIFDYAGSKMYAPAPRKLTDEVNEEIRRHCFIALSQNTDTMLSQHPLTYIGPTGIYTGTLTALQVNAVDIDAASIKTGTLSADRIAAGSIKADKLDATSIRTGIVNADYINGLNCTFSRGKIGGWSITESSLMAGAFITGDTPIQLLPASTGSGYWYTGNYKPFGLSVNWIQSANAGHIVFGQVAAAGNAPKHGFIGIQMMTWDAAEYFCLSANYTRSGSKEVYNRIAGWAFDNTRIWKNSVSLGADGSIQNGARWQLNNDGSGRVAAGNIVWDAAGNVTFGPSVTMQWAGGSKKGQIYVRGTGFNRMAARIVRVNGTDVVNEGGRGLALTLLRRDDLAFVSNEQYDVYLSDDACNNLASRLNALTENVIVVLTSYDAIYINTTLRDAIARCGGDGWCVYNRDRHPFAFIGIPGIGKGNGLTSVCGTGANAPYAEIVTEVIDGVPTGISTGSARHTYIDGNGIYTGTISASQLNVDSTLVVGGLNFNGSISVRNASDSQLVTLDRNGITAIGGTIGGWTLNNSQITSGPVALSSGGAIINGNRWGLYPDGSGMLAGGKFSWDAGGNITATGGNFIDMTIQGTIRSAFVLNDASIWSESTDEVDPRHYDNVVLLHTSINQVINLPWSHNQSGRRICLAHFMWRGLKSYGTLIINAPDGKYFYEDGTRKSSLSIGIELVELLGYADDIIFYGWIVINRRKL